MKNKKERMYAAIELHGANLNVIFKTGIDNIILCKKLRRIEAEAERKALDYCNGKIETDDWEGISDTLLSKVEKVLGFTAKGVPVFINGDPRGYALKIRDEYIREHNIKIYQDWGGYGILAPDLTNG